MPTQNSGEDTFTQEAIAQWTRIGQRFYTDIPSFARIWNDIVEAAWCHADDHPVSLLYKYMDSLKDTCQQALYSQERLHLFSGQEASNVFGFYVAHYLYDFLARVKTVTDLLALVINHIFELGLEEEKCSLEKGKLSSTLIQAAGDSDPSSQCMKQLGSKLDKARTDWLRAFYDLRNLVIHRAGLRFIAMGVSDAGQSRIHLAAEQLLRVSDEREILSKLLTQVGATSLSPYQTIDPVRLCEGLWAKLTELVEDVIDDCQPQIVAFVSSKTA